MTWLVHLGGSQRAARTGRHSPQLLITDSWAITRLFSVVASPSSTCHIPRRSAASKIPCSYFEAIHRHGLAYGDTPPELSVVTRRPAFSLSPRCLAASIAAAGGSRRRAWSTRPLGPLRSSADPILQSIPDTASDLSDRADPPRAPTQSPAVAGWGSCGAGRAALRAACPDAPRPPPRAAPRS